jgi:hypothetical protein
MAITEELLILIRSVGALATAGEVEKVSGAVTKSGESAKKASKEHLGFKSALGSLKSIALQTAGIAGVGALTVGIGQAVKAAEDMQAANATLGQAIRNNVRFPARDATEQMDKFAESLALKGGYAPVEAIQSMSRLLTVTQDTGKAQKDLALASNIARGAHIDLTRATRAVMMVEGGRTTGLGRMGIFLKQVHTAQDQLAAARGKHTAAEKEAAKVQDQNATRVQAMTVLWQKYGHTTDAYSKTAAGSISNLRNTVDVLEERLGRALLPTITVVVAAISHFVEQMMDGVGTGGQVVHIVEQIALALKDAYNWLKPIAPVLAVVTAAWLGYKVAMIVSTVATNVMAAAQAALNIVMDANPILLVAAALAVLVAGLLLAYKHVKWFHQAVDAMGRAAVTAFRWVKQAAVDAFNWIKRNWPLLAGVLFGPIGLAVAEIIKHFDTIKKIPGQIVHAFQSVGNAIANAIVWPFKWAFGWVKRHLPSFHTHHIGPIPIPLPSFPGLAAGGITPYTGAFVVGERGPELVTLPKGASVAPNQGGGSMNELITLLKELIQQERQLVVAVDGRPLAKVMMRQGLLQQSLS